MNLRLYKEIQNIFDKDKLEDIQKIINDFQEMSLIEFFNIYDNILDLQDNFQEFADIADKEYVDKYFNEDYKKDYLDSIILWLMKRYGLALMISGKKIQDSISVIDDINTYVLEDLGVKVYDKFVKNILIESIFQNVNSQLEKEDIQFLQFDDETSIDTHYFFLFKNIIADKLLSDYKNSLFLLKKITCDNYVCSFYIDTEVKKIYAQLNYKEYVKDVLNSEIDYLLNQGIRNFLISYTSDIELEILKIFKERLNKYINIKLECYIFNNFKEFLLKQCTKLYYLKNNSDDDIFQCNNEIFEKSNLVTYLGYIKDYAIIREHIVDNDDNDLTVWKL